MIEGVECACIIPLFYERSDVLEKHYQAKLIKRLQEMFPGSIVMKNDSSYRQGLPDLTIFYKTRWACLEVKASRRAAEQPNQEHYINALNGMSFAAFIYPENEEEVLDALQQALDPPGAARHSRSK